MNREHILEVITIIIRFDFEAQIFTRPRDVADGATGRRARSRSGVPSLSSSVGRSTHAHTTHGEMITIASLPIVM